MTAADKLKAARDFPPVVDHLRKTSEAIVLLLVILSPWAWGCVHPLCRYFLTAGIAFLLLLWAVELLIAPRPFSMSRRFVIPIGGLVAIAILQLLPLGSMVGMISPQSAAIQAELMPNEMEVLADGATAEPPFWTARGRVSVYPAETMRRCLWLIQVVLLFVRVQSLASVDTIRRLCLACMINGSVLAYFAVIHHFTAEEPGRTFWVFQSRGASFGPFINRNHFAFYTNICFGLSIGLLGSRQMGTDAGKGIEGLVSNLKDAKSLWMASVLVFMLGAVILCSSRGGMLSLAGALIITAVFVASTGSFKHGWKWFALAATIFMLAAATQMWLGFDFLESRYTNHEDDRTQLWLPLLRLIPKFPIIGSGLGTLAQLEPSTRTDGMLGDFYLEYAHNEYLQLAIETGIVGLLCGCGFLLMLTLKVAKRIRDSRHNAWLYVGLLFSLSTIALHSFAEFGLAVPAIAVLAATVFGHIAGLGRIQSTDAPAVSTRICQAVFAVCLLAVAALSVRDAKLNDLAQRSNISALRHKRVIHETRLLRDRVQQGKIDEAKEQVPSEAELTSEIDRHIGEAMQDYDTAVAYGTDNTELLLDGVELRFEERTDFTLADPNELLKAQKAVVRARELCPSE